MARYRKILALLDLSADSEHIVAAARDMAQDGAQVVLLHVVEFVPVEPMGEALMPTVQIEDELMDRARQKLATFVTRLGITGTRARVEAGNTKSEIVRVADEEAADLIVLGGHERHGLAVLVNLTEDTVLHAARCDVLAVRLKQP